LEEKPEWIIVPLTHQLFRTTAAKERFEEIVVRGKALHGKALCASGPPQQIERRRTPSTNGESVGGRHRSETTIGQIKIKNEEHNGYNVEARV
jgi:hypothetical protein